MASINDLREPIEVYQAAVGDRGPLIEYLRSDRPIGSWMREALAAYLAGELKPELQKGRPPKKLSDQMRLYLARAHYLSVKHWTEQDGVSTHGKAADMRAEVARTFGLIPEQFEQEFHRGIPKPKLVYGLQARFLDWYRNTHKK